MRIQVLHNYGSVAMGAARIEPGDYEIDDPRLFGRGDYLVKNGHAVPLEGPAVVQEVAPEEEPVAQINGVDVEETPPVQRRTRR